MWRKSVWMALLAIMAVGSIGVATETVAQRGNRNAMMRGGFIVPSINPFPVYDQTNSGDLQIYPDAQWAEFRYNGVRRRAETCLAVVYAIIEHARGNTTYRIGREIGWSDAVGASTIRGVSGGTGSNASFGNGQGVLAQLNRGNPVILYTPDLSSFGHFILAVGMDDSGQIVAHDPLGGLIVRVNPVNGVVTGGQNSYTISHYREVDFADGANPRTTRPPTSDSANRPPAAAPQATPIMRRPGVPRPIGPGSESRDNRVELSGQVDLRWNASPRADGYEVELRDSLSNELLFGQSTLQTSVSVPLPAGRQMQWQVRACNATGCSGNSGLRFLQSPAQQGRAPAPAPRPTQAAPAPTSPPAPPAQVRLPAPPPPAATATSAPQQPRVPASPAPGSTNGPGPEQVGSRVTLRWSAVSGAQDYDLGIRDMVTNRLVIDQRVSGTSFTASLQPGGRYRWNVAACNGNLCSSFTTPLYFTVQAASSASAPPPPSVTTAAVPSTPRNAVPGRSSSPGPSFPGSSITLQWDAVNGATYYDVDLRDMTTRQDIAVSRLSQRYHIFRMTDGHTYRWSVSACNASGCSASSGRLYFTAE